MRGHRQPIVEHIALDLDKVEVASLLHEVDAKGPPAAPRLDGDHIDDSVAVDVERVAHVLQLVYPVDLVDILGIGT